MPAVSDPMGNTIMTKSEVAAVISRIERAPNVSILMKAVDAALGSNAIGINRVGRQWEVSESGFAIYAASFATVRRRLASYVEDAHTHDEASEEAAPAMVAQPAQMQQANAGSAAAVTGYVVVKKWLGDDGVLYASRFPVVLPKAADAGGVICMLLSGTSKQYESFFGAADRKRDAILDMEEVRVPAAMFPQHIQMQQACAAPAQTPSVDTWMRISRRIYGDSLLGAIQAERSDVVFQSDWYRDRALPVVRVENGRYVVLGYAEDEDGASACGTSWGCRFDVAILTRDADRPLAYILLGDGEVRTIPMVAQPVQQAQARDLRCPPAPREIRITARGRIGHPCVPTSPEAFRWIVTDGRLSRECASHQEAIDLADDFRVWGYVVPAVVGQPEPAAETAPPVRVDYVAAILDELVQEDADAAEIAAIYAVGPLGGRKVLAPGRDGIDVFDEGDDSKPYTTLPRGLPPRTARLLIDYWERGYERGLKNGAAEIQSGMKRLLGVSAP